MERVVSRVVLGPVPPVVLTLAGWWGTYLVAGDSPWIPWMAIGGLLSGLVLDLTALRHWTSALFALSSRSLAAIAIFYAVMIYGFFMGLPAPLLLIPLAWGFVAGRPRGERAGSPTARVLVAARGSSLIVLVLCAATAAFAFSEPSIERQVRGMLGLAFTPTIPLLVVASLLGGLLLVTASYWTARAVGTRALHSGVVG